MAVLVTLGAIFVLTTVWWAGRQRYVRFEEHEQVSKGPWAEGEDISQAADQGSADPPLPVMSKVRVYATGFFEVSGMRRYFVQTPADYTTFETREHCVMTQVSLTRFLLLAKSHENEVGWWYHFFQPDTIRTMYTGCLYFGLRPRPALHLEIAQADDSEDESLYLTFDDEATLSLVLADLQHDADL